MSQERTPVFGFLSHLRWAIPLAVALFGIGALLIEDVVIQGYPIFSPHVVRIVLVIGLGGPVLTGLALNWVAKVAKAERRAQQQLAFRNRELAALNAIGEVAGQSLDLEVILDAALQKMVELMELQAGEIRLLEGNYLVLKTHYGTSESKTEEKIVRLGQCVCGSCAQTGNTLTINDLPSKPSMSHLPCAREGFRSIISVPMKTKGQVQGVILLASRDQKAIAIEDQQILTAIGYRVAAAVENARLFQEARRNALQLETASLVGQRMTALLDLDALLPEIVRLIRVRFGYYHVHIFLVEEETNELVLKEASGLSADLIKARGLRFKVGQEGITGWVAGTGQTLLCNDVSREPRYIAAELVPATKAELAVPLRVGTRIIGVLDIQSNRRDSFNKEDVTVLQILGNQLGIAIENARLFQETQRRYDAMATLHEISLDIISQLDMAALFEALLRRGAHLLGANSSSIFFYDAQRDLIYNVANYNTWRDWAGVTVRPGEGVIGQVILTGKPLIVNDYKNWPHVPEVFKGAPQSRVMGSPLKWQNQVIGGVIVANEDNSRPFDNGDLWLLNLFADLATIAVKNAELHTHVKGFSQQLEQKVEERTQELSRAKEEVAAKAEQLRALLAKTISIQEEERGRIARDMHDGVIQLITGMRYELQAARVVAGEALTPAARGKLDATNKIIEELKTEIRRVIYDLHPPTLDAVGLAPAIQKYVARFQDLSEIKCQVEITGNPARLSPSTEIAVFRIVEEALQNVAIHAGARTTSVAMAFEPETLAVTITDDGHGFDYEHWTENLNGEHLGLLGMQERVASLGGTWAIHSNPESGTSVNFQLPVNTEA